MMRRSSSATPSGERCSKKRSNSWTESGPASRISSWNASMGAKVTSGGASASGLSSHQEVPFDR
jgi:hypothetical protein